MKRIIALGLLLAVPLTLSANGDGDLEKRAQASRAVIKGFFGELKGQLVSGIKKGGPVEAIKVCNTTAPAIAKKFSDQKGWRVARTSLKLRNPANAPDAWEKAVLEQFEARKAAGEDPKKMEFYEVVEVDGKQSFRYMKAIPTAEKPCLVCHGGNIKPEVAAALDEKYPNDQARGYKAGDIRGAFTITQPM
jgi:hypothetical protein